MRKLLRKVIGLDEVFSEISELRRKISEQEESIKSFETKPNSTIIFQGQEAEAIKELLKQSPYIKIK